MKKLAIMILAVAASLTAADYTGGWKGVGGLESSKYGVVPKTATMTLVQSGNSVTGTLQIGSASAPVQAITSGTVSGNTITFAVGTGATGTLTQNGAQLQGRLTSSKGDIFDVVFTQQ